MPRPSERGYNYVGMMGLQVFATAAMLLFIMSRIFVGDYIQRHNMSWDILLCALLGLFTYVLWFKWSSDDHSQTGNVPTRTVEPEGALLRNEPGDTSEGGATMLNSDEGQSLETVSTSRSRKASESDDILTQEPVENTPKTKLGRAAYTVGWICAISTEHVAAQLFLDEEHEPPEFVSTHDNNSYVLGRVGKHNVVIAVLPDGQYGNSSATAVARDMLHSFPNIRIGLMVGIAGGAPSKNHDIRLGDVVVSVPREGKNGVLQHDFGKVLEGQGFQMTGFQTSAPTVLRTAVNGLKSKYTIYSHKFERDINTLLRKHQRLQHEFKRPEPSSDRLYRTGFPHQGDKQKNCDVCCGSHPSTLVARRQRTSAEENPAIHYGLIASANSLMKDAFMRDKLAAEEGVLCFEMEAAGLTNHFSCLVIRGICDYSDTHKNKEWQGYAAMVAAAYAKDILYQVAPNSIETEMRLDDTVLALQKVVKDFTEAQLQAQEHLAKKKLSEEDQYCHQLFRLTSGSAGATYESYKDRVEERVEDTCLWFVQHEHFQKWVNQEDSGVLLISADPGCGKSVLAKYLIDDYLPRSSSICYFFFKDQDQNTTRQALCALLHQLFEQQPFLIKHAEEQRKKDGENLRNSRESLWRVFRNATSDPQAGPITIVLDALDECAESEFEGLMKNVQKHFNDARHGKLKCILTSRPYSQILFKFQGLLRDFPVIHIPAESESEAIGQEVNLVITYRVNQLLEKRKLSPNTASHLEKRLKETTQRTYLWVYLVFEYLEKENFKNTPKGVEKALLPGNFNEAYEQMLCKSPNTEMTKKVLSIILAADRPLTIMEMNVAVNIDATLLSFGDLDLETEDYFTSRLKFCCGLFVSIHQGKIYFLHQTAREFLLADLATTQTIQSGMKWYKSITSRHAHAVLAELCVRYLDFFNISGGPQTLAIAHQGQTNDIFAFLHYSSESWGAHFREAGTTCDAAIIKIVLRICDPSSSCYSTWFSIYSDIVDLEDTVFPSLMIASYFGHYSLAELLLAKGANVDSTDSFYHQTPLSWAAKNGHDAVTKLLVDNGAEVNHQGRQDSQTPLSWAAANGHNTIVVQLLGKGAKVDTMDMYGQTPLSWACREGYVTIVKLLLDNGAEVNSKDHDVRTPLSWAIQNNHRPVIELLLEEGGVVDSEDTSNQTPLSWAAAKGHYDIVQPLLTKGAEVDYKDNKYGRTPLSWAAENGMEPIVELLLEKRAVVDSMDMNGQTPLSLAAESGHYDIVKLLVNKGAAIDSKDSRNWTPLFFAAQNGHAAIVEFLLNKKAAIDSKDKRNQTPLFFAAQYGHEAVVELLLNNGAEVNSKDSRNQAPLFFAAQAGNTTTVELLLKWGAEVASTSKEELAALRHEYGYTD